MRHSIEAASAVAALLTTLAGPVRAQILIITPPGGDSKTVSYTDVDCSPLKLMVASAVPAGPVRKYGFQGICRLLSVQASTKSGLYGTPVLAKSDKSATVVGSVWAKAAATWNVQTGELREEVVVSGAQNGKVQMQLKCGSDPVLAWVPCTGVAYENGTGWKGFDHRWALKVPVTVGRASLFEAVALSKQSGNASPPPPPPAPKTSPPVPANIPARQLPSSPPSAINPGATGSAPAIPVPFTIEIESLAGSAQATGGQVGVQPMAGFKPGWWGADAQLFWPVNQVGAQLQLHPFVPRPGRYSVSLNFTGAPDYAIGLASLDGQPGVIFNGYAPGVSRDKILIGVFDLAAGPHTLTVQVRGRDPKSTAHYIGLDQLVFEPN